MESADPSVKTAWHHRVSYGETDAMGYAYYGNYLHWFEQARGQFIREQGMSYAEVEKNGILLPVREATCRYRIPVTYDQKIVVIASIPAFTRASLTFAYEVQRDGLAVASGTTQHACVNPEGRPVRIPQWLSELVLP